MKYKYYKLKKFYPTDEDLVELNKLGEEGWEYVETKDFESVPLTFYILKKNE